MTARTVLLAAPHTGPDSADAARYVGQLARLLRTRHGCRVVIATTAPEGCAAGRYDGPDGVPVYRLPATGTVSPGYLWRRGVRRVIEAEAVDLVNAHTYASAPLLADAAARASGDLPFVLTCHPATTREGQAPSGRWRARRARTVLARTARRAREVVCSSAFTALDLPDLFLGRSTTICPGADPEWLPTSPVPDAPPVPQDVTASLGGTVSPRAVPEPSWECQSDRTVEVFDRAADGGRAIHTVAVVAPNYLPKIGGVENYARRVAHAVADDPAMRAVVITASPTRWRTSVGADRDVPVVRLGTWARHLNTPVSPLWLWQVPRWLRRLDVDLVNAHAPVPGLGDLAVAVSGRRPSVLTYHAGTMVQGHKDVDLLVNAYERHVLPRVFSWARVLVASSPVSLAAGRPGAVEITPGVDVDRFTPGPPASTRPRTVIYVGRLDRASPWKGVDVLLRAFAALADLPDVRLRLVGGGDAVPDHLAHAQRLGIADRVEFTGGLVADALVAAMQSAAVLVLPSQTEHESFGMVLVEAMACGTPVVGSDTGGPRHVIVPGVTGLLFPHADADALAAACRRLLRDGRLADRMGAAGRSCVVERYAWPTLTERYLRLFRSLLPTAPAPARGVVPRSSSTPAPTGKAMQR
ncbi:glycosyltransferase [Streptomyces sp. NPDC049915]|uniref:glycosyltransferase n=1 Tax=Streptomyces sp. NPDC049915 TaxID=3155510 RepID=UPI003435195E